MGKNERTLQMMQNYCLLHDEGMSPREIAEKFDLSPRTVYYVLQEIADKAGVSRDSLLESPHSEHQPFERVSEPVKPIDIGAFSKKFQNALGIMGEFKEMVEMALDDAEEYERNMERGLSNGTCDDEG